MAYNSEDPAQVKKAEKAAADRLLDIDYILKEPRGRRWLFDLVYGSCHADLPSHVPADADTTAFNEGGRAVGLKVLEEIKTKSPDKFILMLQENAFDE